MKDNITIGMLSIVVSLFLGFCGPAKAKSSVITGFFISTNNLEVHSNPLRLDYFDLVYQKVASSISCSVEEVENAVSTGALKIEAVDEGVFSITNVGEIALGLLCGGDQKFVIIEDVL